MTLRVQNILNKVRTVTVLVVEAASRVMSAAPREGARYSTLVPDWSAGVLA